MFGISCAPKILDLVRNVRLMTQVLQGCERIVIFLDYIMVHGKTMRKRRLRRFYKDCEKILTLNKEKYQFRKREIAFPGHYVLKKGIKPSKCSKNTITQFSLSKNNEESTSVLFRLGLLRKNNGNERELEKI